MHVLCNSCASWQGGLNKTSRESWQVGLNAVFANAHPSSMLEAGSRLALLAAQRGVILGSHGAGAINISPSVDEGERRETYRLRHICDWKEGQRVMESWGRGNITGSALGPGSVRFLYVSFYEAARFIAHASSDGRRVNIESTDKHGG